MYMFINETHYGKKLSNDSISILYYILKRLLQNGEENCRMWNYKCNSNSLPIIITRNRKPNHVRRGFSLVLLRRSLVVSDLRSRFGR